LSKEQGHESEVLFHYKKALEINPNYSNAHNNLAILYAVTGDLGKARMHWEKALALNPNLEEARKNLQRLDQMQNSREGADGK
jgi:Flp pilus assembly protein TadD